VSVHHAALAISLILLFLCAASVGLYIGSRRDAFLLGAPTSADMQDRFRRVNGKIRPKAKAGMIVFGVLAVAAIVVTLAT
jgi:hypothetical protein